MPVMTTISQNQNKGKMYFSMKENMKTTGVLHRYWKSVTENYASAILFISAIADSSISVFPVATVFLLFTIFNKRNGAKYTISVIAGTLAGAASGYLLGHLALVSENDNFRIWLQSVMENTPGYSISIYYKLRVLITENGQWILPAGSFTPLPYGLFSLTAGICNSDPICFYSGTLATAALKYIIPYLVILRLKTRSGSASGLKSYIPAASSVIILIAVMTLIIHTS